MANQLPKPLEKLFHNLGTNNSSEIATAILAGFKMFFIPMATAKDKKATPEQKKYTIARDMITEALALTGYIGITQVVKNLTPAPLCKRYYTKKAKLIEQGKIPGVKLSDKDLGLLKNVNTRKLKEVGMNYINPKSKASKEAIDYVKQLENVVAKASKNWAEHSNVLNNPNGFKQRLFDAFDSKAKIVAPKNLFKDTRLNMSQVSVWILALTVIPMACNAIMPTIMKGFDKLTSGKKAKNKPAVVLMNTTVNNVNIDRQKGKPTFERNYNMVSLGNMRV